MDLLSPGMSGWLTLRFDLGFLVCEASGLNKVFSAKPLTAVTKHTEGLQTDVASLRARGLKPGCQQGGALQEARETLPHAPGTPGGAPALGILRRVAAAPPSRPRWWPRHLWSPALTSPCKDTSPDTRPTQNPGQFGPTTLSCVHLRILSLSQVTGCGSCWTRCTSPVTLENVGDPSGSVGETGGFGSL